MAWEVTVLLSKIQLIQKDISDYWQVENNLRINRSRLDKNIWTPWFQLLILERCWSTFNLNTSTVMGISLLWIQLFNFALFELIWNLSFYNLFCWFWFFFLKLHLIVFLYENFTCIWTQLSFSPKLPFSRIRTTPLHVMISYVILV